VGFVVDKWHWDRFFSEFFWFFLPISFYRGSPVKDRSSEKQPHPIDMNNTKYSSLPLPQTFLPRKYSS
jgi:hypothetical protein